MPDFDWHALTRADTPECPALPYDAEPVDWLAINSDPQIDASAWVSPNAVVTGRVRIGARSSVWHQCVIRGDAQFIDIGDDTNIQDGSILHIDSDASCRVGNRVSLGHRALVHASVVEDDTLIGMSATVLSRCTIGRGSIIAAGAVVLEGTIVSEKTIWAGVPAKQIGEVTPEHQDRIEHTWKHYANMSVAMLQAAGSNRVS